MTGSLNNEGFFLKIKHRQLNILITTDVAIYCYIAIEVYFKEAD